MITPKLMPVSNCTLVISGKRHRETLQLGDSERVINLVKAFLY